MSLLDASGALRAASPNPAPSPPVHALASLALAVAAAVAFATALASAFGVRPHVEVSDSMRPALRAGDVVWLRDVAAREAEVGDVVAFPHPQRGDVVLHRVVSRRREGGRLAFTTRGDANTGVERWTATPGGTLGRATAVRVPHAGRAVAVLAGPPLAILASLAGLALAGLLLRRVWR
jgi:signal peptidase I